MGRVNVEEGAIEENWNGTATGLAIAIAAAAISALISVFAGHWPAHSVGAAILRAGNDLPATLSGCRHRRLGLFAIGLSG